MLVGEYKFAIDAKGRVFIPAKHRDELGEAFVVARDIRQHCLKIYSQFGWEQYISKIKDQKRELSEIALRFLHRNAAQCTPDAQGRIVLTADLIQYAEIKKEIVIVGCSDYAELWSEENYDAMVAKEDPDAIRTALEEYGL